MLTRSQHRKGNARSDCGEGSTFPEAAALHGAAALHRQGEQTITCASGTPGWEGARLAELFKISREAWLSFTRRVDLLWSKAVGRHRGTADLPGELAWPPPLVSPAVGTEVWHNQRQDSANTSHSQLGMVPGIISDSVFLAPQKGSTRVEVSCSGRTKSETTRFLDSFGCQATAGGRRIVG